MCCLPNNTKVLKVVSLLENNEELLVERQVTTDMVYWDMVSTFSWLLSLILSFSARRAGCCHSSFLLGFSCSFFGL